MSAPIDTMVKPETAVEAVDAPKPTEPVEEAAPAVIEADKPAEETVAAAATEEPAAATAAAEEKTEEEEEEAVKEEKPEPKEITHGTLAKTHGGLLS